MEHKKVYRLQDSFCGGKIMKGIIYKKALAPWKDIKRSKKHGGLGFKDVWRQSVALFAKHMGGFMTNQANAQWHKLLQAFIEFQRGKRCNNTVRIALQPQETLLLKRKIYPGKSYLAKALISAWENTTTGLHWSPMGVNLPSHLTLRDLTVLIMREDGMPNEDIKLIMADLRRKGVTTLGQLWAKREKLMASEQTQLSSLTSELLRKVNTSTGPERGRINSTSGWYWNVNQPVKNFQRTAKELYHVTDPDPIWTTDLNRKWRLRDDTNTWKRRCQSIWNSHIPPKDATFLWRIFRQGLYTADRAEKFGFGAGECPALDKSILKWRDNKGSDKLLSIVKQLLDKVPEEKFTTLHKWMTDEIQNSNRANAGPASPPSSVAASNSREDENDTSESVEEFIADSSRTPQSHNRQSVPDTASSDEEHDRLGQALTPHDQEEGVPLGSHDKGDRIAGTN
ncbi:hypothetical protein R1sor_023014 [Riccia sorocarpa]|uniref:Uncharacterized protein n=1 Tax=Riccia sorocarpa TaxID=122646 RepID=A0ABD3GLH3_9MARC